MQTSAAIAEVLGESAVMVRRTFLLLHKAGLLEQRKGPSGGARLKKTAKEIGLGDVYLAAAGEWMVMRDPALMGLMKRARAGATEVMNETTLAQVVKRMKKATAK
jgi:DNA-binding IscR family transcriptional regulator